MAIKKIIWGHWQFILILTLAAVLRFWRIEDLTTFGGDQGYDFLVVKKILSGNLSLLGPKIGPYNNLGNLYLGPAYYYLLAPFLFIFKLDPIGPAVLSVLLSIGAIFVIYQICIKFFNKETGIIASVLYSSNSFLIDQSRAPSNPHLTPLFSSVATYSMLTIIIKNSKSIIWPIIAGVCLGLIFQLHYLALSLLIVSLLILILTKRIKSTFYVIASFLVTVSPQILFELRHQFFITNQIIKQFKYGQAISGKDIFIGSFLSSIKNLYTTLLFSNITLIFIALIFILVSIQFLIKKNNSVALLFLTLPIVVNVIFASLYSSGQPLHYFSTIYPNLVILTGVVFVSIYQKYKTNAFAAATLLIVIGAYLAANVSNLELDRKEGYTMPKGWNLTGIKKASQIVSSDTNSFDKFNIAATLDGDTRAMPYRYLVEVYGKQPLGVEQYPQSRSIYLISRDDPEQIYQYSVWGIASFRPFKIDSRWPIQNGITLYKLTKE